MMKNELLALVEIYELESKCIPQNCGKSASGLMFIRSSFFV